MPLGRKCGAMESGIPGTLGEKTWARGTGTQHKTKRGFSSHSSQKGNEARIHSWASAWQPARSSTTGPTTGHGRGCQEPCSSLSWHQHRAESLLWVVLHVQSQASKECECDSAFIVVVWAAGQPFLLSAALTKAGPARWAAQTALPGPSWGHRAVLASAPSSCPSASSMRTMLMWSSW